LIGDYTWIDGERLIRFGDVGDEEALGLLEGRELFPYVLLIGSDRWLDRFPAIAAKAAGVFRVPGGPVPPAAAAVRKEIWYGFAGHNLVALGGGRVIDSVKGIAGADGLQCAAIPTTLSGAEMTPFHRMPEGVAEWKMTRPGTVLSIPSVMASQPPPDLAASAMNALAHAVEALYTPGTNPALAAVALHAAELIGRGLEDGPDRALLARGALLAGYTSGLAGFAVHHAVCQTIVRVADTPHAQTNAVMLPHFVRMMETRVPEAITELAAALGAPGPAGAADRIAELSARAGVTRLGELGVDEAALEEVLQEAVGHPALANTPDPPDGTELREVLGRAL
jgi:alcohol dehydrogenase class IV